MGACFEIFLCFLLQFCWATFLPFPSLPFTPPPLLPSLPFLSRPTPVWFRFQPQKLFFSPGRPLAGLFLRVCRATAALSWPLYHVCFRCPLWEWTKLSLFDLLLSDRPVILSVFSPGSVSCPHPYVLPKNSRCFSVNFLAGGALPSVVYDWLNSLTSCPHFTDSLIWVNKKILL